MNRKKTAFSPALAAAVAGLLAATPALAGPPFQPSGTNLTLGDVTHGQRVQSASGNPAAAAADQARSAGKPVRGMVISGAAGIEYGNIQDLFDLYDEITGGYKPSPPDDGGGLPGQLPEDKPGGIDLGEIWDRLDPDVQDAINRVASEVVRQTALLALIATEGYARAWVTADAPVMIGKPFAGGAWTFDVNWSGASKAFGVADPIEFDRNAARDRLQEWLDRVPELRPPVIELANDVELTHNPVTNAVLFSLKNDSSLVAKAAQTTDLSIGYSRPAWSGESGTLYLGGEAHLYLRRLSRYTARFGDITDSEELFDEIRNAQFRSDEGFGLDIGALWVGRNYQVGAQVINVNEPEFTFPDVDLAPYQSQNVIDFLERDRVYRMDRQLKLEASLFGAKRKWSIHAGLDADPVTERVVP